MLLNPHDAQLFFRLYPALMFFVNQRLKVLPDGLVSPEGFGTLAPEDRLKVREALLDHTDLIQSFVDENPAHLPDDDLAIVRSWRHLVAGKFFVYRYLKKHAIFLNDAEPPIAYGVVGLTQPLADVAGPAPVWVDTALLPYDGRIVCDGLLGVYSVSFGPGFRRSLAESYREAKSGMGIITSLVAGDTPAAVKKSGRKSPEKKSPPKKSAGRKPAARKPATKQRR